LSETKPIRSAADYDVALAEADRLWGARSGTPEGDRLDVLATLIDAHESEHHPIAPATKDSTPPSPGRGFSRLLSPPLRGVG
jgi:antitoxin component HigA of HigAB toxin-antitoxin module